MEKNTALTPTESLQIISSMINTVQKRFSENGFLYLLWGWLVFFCGIAQFILLHFFKYPYHSAVWSLTWVALIFQIIYLKKKKASSAVKTYTDSIIGYIWISFLILMAVILSQFMHVEWNVMLSLVIPILLALYGLPVFLCGALLRFRPLIIGAICCWILSVFAGFISYEYQILLIPAAMVVAWIIPGYILRKKFSEQEKDQPALQQTA